MIKKVLNVAFFVIAIIYILLLLDLFFRLGVIQSGSVSLHKYNFIPFKTIWAYISGESPVSRTRAMLNVVGNIAVFIPFGLYLQVLRINKGLRQGLLIVLFTSISIELIQYVFGLGASDIDDVILNVLGGFIGMLGYWILEKVIREADKTKTAITIVSLVIGTPLIVFYIKLFIDRFF